MQFKLIFSGFSKIGVDFETCPTLFLAPICGILIHIWYKFGQKGSVA